MLDRHSSMCSTPAHWTCCPPARYRRWCQTPLTRGARTRSGAAVERELVLGLRGPGPADRRLDPARSGAQPEGVVDQRAGVPVPTCDDRAAGPRGAGAGCDPATVVGDGVELRHGATVPLQSYRVEVRGAAQAYDDPSAILRGEPGRPAELAMDLTWTTTGTPYAYRITTRYEIPAPSAERSPLTATPTSSPQCPVSATTPTVCGGLVEHGLGLECALHLDDGTHLHGVDLRIPGLGPVRRRLPSARRRACG